MTPKVTNEQIMEALATSQAPNRALRVAVSIEHKDGKAVHVPEEWLVDFVKELLKGIK